MQHDAKKTTAGNKAKDWMTIIPESDRKAYQKSDKPPMPGPKSALIVIDVTVAFTGSRPQPIEEAIIEFPTACGDAAWEALPRIKELIDLFRAAARPVVFTRSDVRGQQFAGTATKTKRPVNPDPKFGHFPEMIVPRDDEWILEKTKASVFFGTSMNFYLRKEEIDTVVICGVSTSGCVRASTVDAFSHGYTTFVIDDCCFDRSHFAHCANLFDMNAKYATVLSLDEIAGSLK
ncbi:MAG TPA: isochorismatase family protein [Herbaspirillum sp.]|jgi:nicotinamidase-related amidase